MPIDLSCPNCGNALRTADDKAGRSAGCPLCGVIITVPPAGGGEGQTPSVVPGDATNVTNRPESTRSDHSSEAVSPILEEAEISPRSSPPPTSGRNSNSQHSSPWTPLWAIAATLIVGGLAVQVGVWFTVIATLAILVWLLPTGYFKTAGVCGWLLMTAMLMQDAFILAACLTVVLFLLLLSSRMVRTAWTFAALLGLTFLSFTGFGSSKVEDRLVGNWELTDGESQGSLLEFTEGGKVLIHGPEENGVGIYSVRGSTLSVREGDTTKKYASQYEMEFMGDTELILVKTDDGLDFDRLNGRWRRVGGREGTGSEPDGQLAEKARKNLNELQGRRDAVQALLDKTRDDQEDVVLRMRQMGIEKTSDLKDHTRGRILVEEFQRLVAEVKGLENAIVQIEGGMAKAKALIRQIERNEVLGQAGMTENELKELSEQLMLAEETEVGELPTVPVDPAQTDALLEQALARP